MSLLIKNGSLVTAEGIIEKDILIEGEKIKEVRAGINSVDLPAGYEVVDAGGNYILPGIIDAHTHYYMKSRNSTTADDFFTGSRSAAMGGVTTFIDYADQKEDISLVDTFQDRCKKADGETVIDYSLHQTVSSLYPEIKDDLKLLREAGINSLKMFTTYKKEGLMIERANREKLFNLARELELLVTVHAEDNQLIEETMSEYQSGKELPAYLHPVLRPARAEYNAVLEVGRLARQLGMPIYIAHLSSAEGYQAFKEIREAGGSIYAETTPHYLTLDNELLVGEDSQKYFMTPPLREKEDNEKLWEGLRKGDIEVVATDHCAYNLEQKFSAEDCLEILPGIPGSETLLPLIYTLGVKRGFFDIIRMIEILSINPAKIFGLYPGKGSVQPGTDADLVIFDPEKEVTISDSGQHSAAGYTPYAGIKVKGYPVITISRGKIIMRDGEFLGERGQGKFVPACESSLY